MMQSGKTTPFNLDEGPMGVLITHRQLDGPIPHLHLFVSDDNEKDTNELLEPFYSFVGEKTPQSEDPRNVPSSSNKQKNKNKNKKKTIDLVVSGAVGYGAMYQDVDQFHLSNPVLLPRSSSHDSVLCTQAADLTWNGRKEVLLGTYGQELLVYRSVLNVQNDTEKDTKKKRNMKQEGDVHREYVLDWQRTFAYPLYSINVGDFDGDGIDELVVTTLQGVHVLKPDLNMAAAKIADIIQIMAEIEELESNPSLAS